MGENGTTPVEVDASALSALVEALRAGGYRVIGPKVRDNAVVLAELDSAEAAALRESVKGPT
jgi:hypothetical protein